MRKASQPRQCRDCNVREAPWPAAVPRRRRCCMQRQPTQRANATAQRTSERDSRQCGAAHGAYVGLLARLLQHLLTELAAHQSLAAAYGAVEVARPLWVRHRSLARKLGPGLRAPRFPHIHDIGRSPSRRFSGAESGFDRLHIHTGVRCRAARGLAAQCASAPPSRHIRGGGTGKSRLQGAFDARSMQNRRTHGGTKTPLCRAAVVRQPARQSSMWKSKTGTYGFVSVGRHAHLNLRCEVCH